MTNNVQLTAPSQYHPSAPRGTGNRAAAAPLTQGGEYGALVQFSNGRAPKSGHYAPDGLGIEDSKRLSMEKSRLKKESEPCQTCEDRKYQDGSDDMGVSFKAPTSIAPSAAASAVISHEQEHVSRAQAEGREKNMNVMNSVVIHTSICPECKKVYVAGGTTYTQMTPKSEAIDAYAKQMGLAEGA